MPYRKTRKKNGKLIYGRCTLPLKSFASSFSTSSKSIPQSGNLIRRFFLPLLSFSPRYWQIDRANKETSTSTTHPNSTQRVRTDWLRCDSTRSPSRALFNFCLPFMSLQWFFLLCTLQFQLKSLTKKAAPFRCFGWKVIIDYHHRRKKTGSRQEEEKRRAVFTENRLMTFWHCTATISSSLSSLSLL